MELLGDLCAGFANFAVKIFGWRTAIFPMRSSEQQSKYTAKLGPGLPESACESCLAFELEALGMRVEQRKAVPLVYETVKLECGFRADLLVEGCMVVELKCKDALHPVDEAQLLSHLRLLDVPVGLLINFHVVLLKHGIKRMVNNYVERVGETNQESRAFNR